jgi:dolichol-phosphate mannosyltransferase
MTTSTQWDARRPHPSSRQTLLRGVKFYAVGGIGIGVQLAALVFLRSLLRIDYRLATVLAVETAVIHNFLWHEKVTWADREGPRASHWLTRLVKFNATNGLLSIVGNLVLMQALVGGLGLNYLVANVLTIAVCSVVNFVVSDRFVFQG